MKVFQALTEGKKNVSGIAEILLQNMCIRIFFGYNMRIDTVLECDTIS